MRKLANFRTESGELSVTKAVNIAFLVLAVIVAVANQFGFTGDLSEEGNAIVAVIVIVINYILRTYKTKEPIA